MSHSSSNNSTENHDKSQINLADNLEYLLAGVATAVAAYFIGEGE